jgi:hypothetical protein
MKNITQSGGVRCGGAKRPPRICGGKYVQCIRDLLKPLHPIKDHPNRELHFDEYVSYVLLHLLNPELDSIRLLRLKGQEQSFQHRFALPTISLGAFSEAGGTFPAAELVPILEQTFERLGPRPSHRELLLLERKPTAFDGSLLAALAPMHWARWREHEHAAKMHMFYDLTQGAPRLAELTDAHTDERAVLSRHIAPGFIYVFDRGLRDYALFEKILRAHSSFVFRSPENIVYEVLESRPLSPEAVADGVQSDQIVRVGCDDSPELKDRRLRLVRIHVRRPPAGGRPRKHVSRKCKSIRVESGDYTLLILTDLLDLDVLLISLLYRCRWQIEIFFRWYKVILKADHLLSQRRNGLLILIYCAILATLLLARWADARPTKYLLRQVSANLMGTLTDGQLEKYFQQMAQPKKIG